LAPAFIWQGWKVGEMGEKTKQDIKYWPCLYCSIDICSYNTIL